jgi:hypothetical protein
VRKSHLISSSAASSSKNSPQTKVADFLQWGECKPKLRKELLFWEGTSRNEAISKTEMAPFPSTLMAGEGSNPRQEVAKQTCKVVIGFGE